MQALGLLFQSELRGYCAWSQNTLSLLYVVGLSVVGFDEIFILHLNLSSFELKELLFTVNSILSKSPLS